MSSDEDLSRGSDSGNGEDPTKIGRGKLKDMGIITLLNLEGREETMVMSRV